MRAAGSLFTSPGISILLEVIAAVSPARLPAAPLWVFSPDLWLGLWVPSWVYSQVSAAVHFHWAKRRAVLLKIKFAHLHKRPQPCVLRRRNTSTPPTSHSRCTPAPPLPLPSSWLLSNSNFTKLHFRQAPAAQHAAPSLSSSQFWTHCLIIIQHVHTFGFHVSPFGSDFQITHRTCFAQVFCKWWPHGWNTQHSSTGRTTKPTDCYTRSI